jgi:pimeloyl-ACP methyl ester carboxylesterase
MQSVTPIHTPEGHTVSVNGMQMYFEIYGEGEPLVLLHWFTGSSQSWKPFIPAFSQDYQLIIPDLRGHGRSTNPSLAFTHRQSALDIFSLLDHLHIQCCKAIGISSGGMSLLHMATQQPARLTAMVLIGSTIYFSAPSRAIQRAAVPESWDWALLRERHAYGDEQISALLGQFQKFADSYDDMNFTSPYLSTITAKTLIVHGDRDAHFPVSIPVEMYNTIPQSYLWIIPNGDHIPIFEKHQAAFTTTVLEFLKGDWD